MDRNLRKIIPFRAVYLAPLIALVVHIVSRSMDDWIASEWLYIVSIIVMFAITFTFASEGEKREFVTLHILEHGENYKAFTKAEIFLLIKISLATSIATIPFILTKIPFWLKDILLFISFLITWYTVYKGLSGYYRSKLILKVIRKMTNKNNGKDLMGFKKN